MKDKLLMLALLLSSAAFGRVVAVAPDATAANATPRVVAAAATLRAGDTLRFEKGEYHFYEEGCTRREITNGGISWGEKRIVFDFAGRSDVTVDGGGATFVWHGSVFPFSFVGCTNATVRHLTMRAFRPSCVELKIEKFLDDGFEFRFAPDVAARVENGALLIDTDLGTFDSRTKIISWHALNRVCINYLFAANETSNRVGLPAPFMNGIAEDLGGGRMRIRNRHQNKPGCIDRLPFRVGEPLCLLLNGRERCSVYFSGCRNARIEDVHVQNGDGMGVVAFMNENLTLDGFCVEPRAGEHISTTADCLFVVNNRGLVEVKNSTFSWALDDAMNIHGNYMRVVSSKGNALELDHIHREYYNFTPHHVGDTVELTDPASREVVLRAKVASVIARADGATLVLEGDVPPLKKGTFVENLTWQPSVHLHDNTFHDVLHLRLSGRGKYVVERNAFTRGLCLLVHDLASYWGEAGRTADMTIRDNLFDAFSSRGGNGPFIVVDGFPASAPRHEGIRIVGNRVRHLPKGAKFTRLTAARNPVVKDNVILPD